MAAPLAVLAPVLLAQVGRLHAPHPPVHVPLPLQQTPNDRAHQRPGTPFGLSACLCGPHTLMFSRGPVCQVDPT